VAEDDSDTIRSNSEHHRCRSRGLAGHYTLFFTNGIEEALGSALELTGEQVLVERFVGRDDE
jgi:hypothetical protein